MPPPGYEPFLSAICERPEEDTARLVYADWLDEHGDHERAEFVRLQVALAPYPRQYNVDHFRAEALLKAHGKAWFAELPVLRGVQWMDEFRRGFVPGARLSAKLLPKHRKALFAATPVQVLTLDNATERELVKALVLTELNRLTELYLPFCQVPLGQLTLLAECPNLRRLRTLGLRSRAGRLDNPHLTLSEAKALAQSPHLPELREVYCSGALPEAAIELLRARFETVRHLGTIRG